MHNSIRTARGNATPLARTRGSSARSPSRRSERESIPSARGRARSGRPPRDSAPVYACRLSAARTSLVTSSRGDGSHPFLHRRPLRNPEDRPRQRAGSRSRPTSRRRCTGYENGGDHLDRHVKTPLLGSNFVALIEVKQTLHRRARLVCSWTHSRHPKRKIIDCNSGPLTLSKKRQKFAPTRKRILAGNSTAAFTQKPLLSALARFRACPHGVRWPPDHCPRRS
jgi:hypothetical protein